MENKVLIREAGAGELEAVEALVKEAYREYRELVPAEAWERWMESITQAIHSRAGQLLVAEAPAGLQGAVQFFPDASRSSQGHWPAGVGTMRLLGQILSMAIATLMFALFIGRTQITPAQYPAFIKSARAALLIFAGLCICGVFFSLSRGSLREK